jgi:hypothetical protein
MVFALVPSLTETRYSKAPTDPVIAPTTGFK